jgi:hypothetical protein
LAPSSLCSNEPSFEPLYPPGDSSPLVYQPPLVLERIKTTFWKLHGMKLHETSEKSCSNWLSFRPLAFKTTYPHAFQVKDPWGHCLSWRWPSIGRNGDIAEEKIIYDGTSQENSLRTCSFSEDVPSRGKSAHIGLCWHMCILYEKKSSERCAYIACKDRNSCCVDDISLIRPHFPIASMPFEHASLTKGMFWLDVIIQCNDIYIIGHDGLLQN